MKLMKRTGIYQASNVTFNPETCEAHSYRWWKFVAVVEGKVVFNSYRYSVSTGKHQSKVRDLIGQLGLTIDFFSHLPEGLNHVSALADLYLKEEEALCDVYLNEELKRQARNEKARVRRAEKQAQLDAEFKANVEKITYSDVLEFRAAKTVQS